MKIVSIVGARPQFIKIAPVSRAINDLNKKEGWEVIRDIVVHTGQHYDYEMGDIFFKELEIKEPDYNLGVGSGSHGVQTGEMLRKIEELLITEKPDIVMVNGDTNSTLAGALAASKLHIRVAHVEAGLRSFNRAMPEEINRVLTDHISDFLFCPTETAVRNLEKEGITKGVYNEARRSRIMRWRRFPGRRITDDPEKLRSIFEALSDLAQRMKVIMPLHPRTRKCLGNSKFYDPITIIKPLSYLDRRMLK
jgi:UDP-GlcNAc3NAcA epimerase